MGRKDTAGREFFSDKRRFAELLNIQFYHGEQVVLAENLMRIRRDYPALAGVYGEKERDLLIADSRHGIHYGMELETESDYSMPERMMPVNMNGRSESFIRDTGRRRILQNIVRRRAG